MLFDFYIIPQVSRQLFSNIWYLFDECKIPECIFIGFGHDWECGYQTSAHFHLFLIICVESTCAQKNTRIICIVIYFIYLFYNYVLKRY